MVSVYTNLKDSRESLLKSASEHGITSIKVFGSVSRMEEHSDSDVDFLVTFEDDRSLFDLIRFKNAAEQILRGEVDIVTENAVHHSIKPQILHEAKPL